MAKVVIIGSGLMGTAMAWPLRDNGHEVHLVGSILDDDIIRTCKETRFHTPLRRTLPEGVIPWYFSESETPLEGADIIVSGVSSRGVDWITGVLAERARPGQRIIGITKGLRVDATGTIHTFPEVIGAGLPAEIRDSVILAAIGGPCIAGELAGRRQTCVMFGSSDLEAAGELAEVFRTPYYHISPTDGLMSLEIGVALKNAFTVAVGIAYGLLEQESSPDEAQANMHNTAAAMFAEGCYEIGRILSIAGGDQSMAMTLPGAGDLYVTCVGGRTITLGRLIGSGKSYSEARAILEGVTLESVEIITEIAKALAIWDQHGVTCPDDLPLLRMLISIIVHDRPYEIPFDRFFT